MGVIMDTFDTLSDLDMARDIAKARGDKTEFLRLCALRPALVKLAEIEQTRKNNERLADVYVSARNCADDNISCHW